MATTTTAVRRAKKVIARSPRDAYDDDDEYNPFLEYLHLLPEELRRVPAVLARMRSHCVKIYMRGLHTRSGDLADDLALYAFWVMNFLVWIKAQATKIGSVHMVKVARAPAFRTLVNGTETMSPSADTADFLFVSTRQVCIGAATAWRAACADMQQRIRSMLENETDGSPPPPPPKDTLKSLRSSKQLLSRNSALLYHLIYYIDKSDSMPWRSTADSWLQLTHRYTEATLLIHAVLAVLCHHPDEALRHAHKAVSVCVAKIRTLETTRMQQVRMCTGLSFTEGGEQLGEFANLLHALWAMSSGNAHSALQHLQRCREARELCAQLKNCLAHYPSVVLEDDGFDDSSSSSSSSDAECDESDVKWDYTTPCTFVSLADAIAAATGGRGSASVPHVSGRDRTASQDADELDGLP